MSIVAPKTSSDALRARRARLGSRYAGPPALFMSGGYRPRNYAANVYPYRGDSSFVYFVGCGIPGAALLVGEAGSELFVPELPPDDEMWHGPSLDFAALKTATGVERVRPVTELAQVVRALPEVASLPCIEVGELYRQAQLLGRPLPPTHVGPWPVEDFPQDEALADAVVETRLIHDEAALKALEGAAEGTVAGHLAGMRATRAGLRESEVRAIIEAEFYARDMDLAYGSIVTVHGEVLHAHSYAGQLADGDLLLVDAGAENDSWAGDVTRTWPVSGKFSTTQRDLYQVVLAAQERGVAMVRSGVRYRDIHLTCSRVLAEGLIELGILRGQAETLVEAGTHAAFFPHGIGHIIGLDVHDMENFGDRAGYAKNYSRSEQFGLAYLRMDRKLAPGMMVTIEPGFYQVPAILNNRQLVVELGLDKALNRERLAQFADVRGIRIEDDVLCTEDAPRVMSANLPKQIEELEAVVGSAVPNN